MSELTLLQSTTINKATELLCSPLPLRDRIANFEAFSRTVPNVEIEPVHTFIDGLYSREIVFEAGTFATGNNHMRSQMDVMVEGEMLVATEEGYKRLVAPMTFITEPGVRKAGIAVKRTRWISYIPTDLTTVEEVEAQLFTTSYDELDVPSAEVQAARDDYKAVLKELNMTEEEVQVEVQLDNLVPMPVDTVRVGMSDIHGVGLFSYIPLVEGQIVAACRIGNFRTIAGRYTNHSNKPNAIVEERDGNLYIVAKLTIPESTEITIDYREARDRSKVCLV